MTLERAAAQELLDIYDKCLVDKSYSRLDLDALRAALAEAKEPMVSPGAEDLRSERGPVDASIPAAPQAAEPAGWILEFKGHDREGVPFYLDKERAEIVAQGFRREVNGISYEVAVIPLYAGAPPAGGEELIGYAWWQQTSIGPDLILTTVDEEGPERALERARWAAGKNDGPPEVFAVYKAQLDARRAKGTP